jgi:DNA-binding NarL/FixJ family response regulator
MIRILLVEDQDLIRNSLKALLEIQPDLQIVGEADNGRGTSFSIVIFKISTAISNYLQSASTLSN